MNNTLCLNTSYKKSLPRFLKGFVKYHLRVIDKTKVILNIAMSVRGKTLKNEEYYSGRALVYYHQRKSLLI